MALPGARRPRRRVDGVLLLDKPPGRSSNAALQHAKWLYAAAKAGHTGTLDPLASGLLPICFGEATKFAQSLLDARKTYVATMRFGIATSTGDAEGDIVTEAPVAFARADLERMLPRFTGPIMQRPPLHAALKYQGRSYYDYARAGIDIPRHCRPVEIHAVRLLDWSAPDATLDVTCSKGTYIRVLAEDLGVALGSCAHLIALRRTAAASFTLDGAVALEAIEAMSIADRDALLLPVHAPLAGMPRLDVDAETARALLQGRIGRAPANAGGRYRCFDGERRFLGVVEVDGVGLHAVRLVATTPATGS